jgi:hypothetical protein
VVRRVFSYKETYLFDIQQVLWFAQQRVPSIGYCNYFEVPAII